LRTQLYIASKVGLLEKEIVDELISELKHISAMLHNAAKTIKQRSNT